MTNNTTGDKLKPYLIKERTRLILSSLRQGFTLADIARIFKIDRSMITRIISKESNKIVISS